MDNFIVPLTRMASMRDSNMGTTNHQQASVPFADIFRNVINETKQAEEVVKQSAIEAANGDVDRLHDLTIASTKADMALKLFVQLRSKGHEAYSEIMRMGV